MALAKLSWRKKQHWIDHDIHAKIHTWPQRLILWWSERVALSWNALPVLRPLVRRMLP